MENDQQPHNPELLDAMRKLKAENSEKNMLELLTHAVRARLMLPVDGEGTLEDGKLRFHAVSGDDGKAYQVVYADWDDFREAAGDKEQRAVVTNFMDLMDFVLAENFKADGFILNPGKEGVLFTNDMLKIIREQLIASSSDESSSEKSAELSVKVGEPNSYPDGLLSAVRKFGDENSNVSALYLRLMQRPLKPMPEWLFILKFDGDQKSAYESLTTCTTPYLGGLEMLILDANDEFALRATSGIAPIYSRQ